ncbi:MAG: hypothetical protein ACI9BD_000254 [Candidatus Marinamargulisbacteria bacterium]|jgi:hypothetical protein
MSPPSGSFLSGIDPESDYRAPAIKQEVLDLIKDGRKHHLLAQKQIDNIHLGFRTDSSVGIGRLFAWPC